MCCSSDTPTPTRPTPKEDQPPPVQGCPACRLVSITVVSNATQTNVTGAKNWAAVKKSGSDVIVEVTTSPNDDATWGQIVWSGDSGSPVAGHRNQRRLSRGTSTHYHVVASLGGATDFVDVWILWGAVTIMVSGTTPPNAVQFGARYDGTETLGARRYNGGVFAVGKVVPVAVITPSGVHSVVTSGWAFRREVQAHLFIDGARSTPDPRYWAEPAWMDDTSLSAFQRLTPDADDKIYDRDAPNIGNFGTTDAEQYANFRQWIEWNASDASHGGTCSNRAEWHWRGRWQSTAAQQATLADVGTGHVALPGASHFHP